MDTTDRDDTRYSFGDFNLRSVKEGVSRVLLVCLGYAIYAGDVMAPDCVYTASEHRPVYVNNIKSRRPTGKSLSTLASN